MIRLYSIFLIFISCNKVSVHPSKGDVVEAVYGLGIIQSENYYNAKAAILSSVKEFYVNEGDDVKKGQKLFVTDQGSFYTAPFSGKITDIPVTVSENLFPNTIILSLVDLTNLYLEVSLEQQGAMKLSPGVKAEVSFEFFRDQKIIGKILTIYPKNDQFVAKVLLDIPKGVLPGMSADVAFEVNRKVGVTLIPTKAVTKGHIIVLRNNKKEKMAVKLGLIDNEKVEVLSPELSIKDEIILP